MPRVSLPSEESKVLVPDGAKGFGYRCYLYPCLLHIIVSWLLIIHLISILYHVSQRILHLFPLCTTPAAYQHEWMLAPSIALTSFPCDRHKFLATVWGRRTRSYRLQVMLGATALPPTLLPNLVWSNSNPMVAEDSEKATSILL